MLSLHTLKKTPGARTRVIRVGRGNASGHGTYSGRGGKGQRARSGGRAGLKRLGFKQTLQRVPKYHGFKSKRARPAVVALNVLAAAFNADAAVNPEKLLKKGLITTARHGVKIIGSGEIKKALSLSGCRVTAGAKSKIEAAGGTINA